MQEGTNSQYTGIYTQYILCSISRYIVLIDSDSCVLNWVRKSVCILSKTLHYMHVIIRSHHVVCGRSRSIILIYLAAPLIYVTSIYQQP